MSKIYMDGKQVADTDDEIVNDINTIIVGGQFTKEKSFAFVNMLTTIQKDKKLLTMPTHILSERDTAGYLVSFDGLHICKVKNGDRLTELCRYSLAYINRVLNFNDNDTKAFIKCLQGCIFEHLTNYKQTPEEQAIFNNSKKPLREEAGTDPAQTIAELTDIYRRLGTARNEYNEKYLEEDAGLINAFLSHQTTAESIDDLKHNDGTPVYYMTLWANLDKIKPDEKIPVKIASSPYAPMLQGSLINAHAHISKKKMEVDTITNRGNIITENGISIFMDSVNNIDLSVTEHLILDYLLMKVTAQIPRKLDAKLEELDKARQVTFTVNEYMEARGLKDRKTANEQIIRSVTSLFEQTVSGEENVVVWEKGKRKYQPVTYDMRILDKKSDASTIIDRGVVSISFTLDMAKYLNQVRYITQYHKGAFKINSKLRPHSYYLSRKLCLHFNMNIGKKNENRISVHALAEACPDLPTYEDIRQTKRQTVTHDIIDKFETNMDALLYEYGILSDWHYCKANGEPVTDEELTNFNYHEWITWLVEFTLSVQPENTEERRASIQEAKQRKAIAQKRTGSRQKRKPNTPPRSGKPAQTPKTDSEG